MQSGHRCRPRRDALIFLLAGALSLGFAAGPLPSYTGDQLSPLQRAKIFLQAADYRRAIEACQEEVRVHPGVGEQEGF